jgi:DNA repair exonuclease SbcCD ATPase subunit
MALTASRSELNVALVGENDVSAMLDGAKKQMAELEGKIRQLTGASKDQADAAKTAAAATVGVNDRLKGYAKSAEGVVEGIDKIKSATDKVIGVFGFLGAAISAAIDVYKFFTEQSEKAKEAQKELGKAMEEQAKKVEATMVATSKLADEQKRAASEARNFGVQIAEDRLRIAKMAGDKEAEYQAQLEVDHAKELARIEELKVSEQELADQISAARKQADEATGKAAAAEKQLEADKKAVADMTQRIADIEANRAKVIGQAGVGAAHAEAAINKEIERLKESIAQKTMSIAVTTFNVLTSERARADQATTTRIELERQQGVLGKLLTSAKGVAAAIAGVFGKAEPDKMDEAPKVRGGGGGGKSKAEREKEAREKEEQARSRLIDFRNEEFEREVAIKREKQLFEQAAALKERLKAELAALPVGQYAKAYDEVRKELDKQLKGVDELLGSRVKADSLFDKPNEDEVVAALKKQSEAYDKLSASVDGLTAVKDKAAESEQKLREEAEKTQKKLEEELEKQARAMPLKQLESYREGISQLEQVAVPAFGEISSVIGQVADQLGKYKDGQTSMAKAVTGSASAIAGAIAKQVGGVKAEAGVRAIFETAMGFATLANPVESAGHFTAAAMFGLAAGGVLKTGASSGAGGQKAPATRTASTTATSSSGGGGPITNVYNLQTGIVDGQSTARAFRQAEQQARNTGMASAGGW